MSRDEHTPQLFQDNWTARYNMTLGSLGSADGRDPDDATRGPESANPHEAAPHPEELANLHSAELERTEDPREEPMNEEDGVPPDAPAPRLEMVASLEITVGRHGQAGA